MARAPKGTQARLESYRSKRDFTRTAEPAPDGHRGGKGKTRKPASAGRRRGRSAHTREATRYVIQEHSATRLHWDLRLEREGVLVSWALPRGVPESPKDNRLAVLTEEHPLEYLSFEGEIPKGQYGAGTMKIWDTGTYECLKWEPRKVEVALRGERLDARYALFALGSEEQPKEWMIHRMDPPADPGREPMPEHLQPMLACLGELPRGEEQEWAYEIKWDGVRALAYSQPGELRLHSRNLNDITAQYPELRRLNRQLSSHSAILDGEVVAFDADGHPSFALLQRRMHVSSPSQVQRLAKATPVTYVIFDLLWLDGRSLMDSPYRERREQLAALQLNGARWQAPEHVIGEGDALLRASAEQRLEGIVAKRLDSTYQPGRRSGAWIKVKNLGRQEFVVGGWMPGKGRRSERIGALLVGFYDDRGELCYAGRVGTGFTDRELDRLAGLLQPLRRDRSPFSSGEAPPRGAVFCEPRLIAEVEFREWTRAGILRAPSYKGLREDKPARSVVREDRPAGDHAASDAPLQLGAPDAAQASVTVEGHELKLSNLAKPIYPDAGFAKRDVIEYYDAIAPPLLAHLEERPLTVKRWPDGVQGEFFYQKQAPAHRPAWVRTATLPSERKPIDYVLVDGRATLIWLANLAALELHTPLARAADVQRPTMLVFDLDPGAPATILECARVGLQLRGMFENLGLQSFAKTSGSKGMQLYVPLNSAEVTYAHTKPFAKTVAEILEQAEPELVVSRMTKARRRGKVLIDWSQNDARKTTVCAYSLRAGSRPTVSTPVEWAEVEHALKRRRAEALSFTAAEVLRRVQERGDLFAPVLSLVQALPGL